MKIGMAKLAGEAGNEKVRESERGGRWEEAERVAGIIEDERNT